MRSRGVIASEVAILGNVAAAGITVLTSVCFREESVTAYQAFRDQMRSDGTIAMWHGLPSSLRHIAPSSLRPDLYRRFDCGLISYDLQPLYRRRPKWNHRP